MDLVDIGNEVFRSLLVIVCYDFILVVFIIDDVYFIDVFVMDSFDYCVVLCLISWVMIRFSLFRCS